jgi:hypothetical protein
MDPRVRRHAEVLVEHCTRVERGDEVLIRAPSAAEDLVVALYEQVGERGANATTWLRSPRAGRARARAMDADDFSTSEHRLAAMRETDAVILVQAAENRAAQADVDPSKGAPASRARKPVLDARLDTRWVITQHPTAADAQAAETSTAAWADTVYDAVDRDWAALHARRTRSESSRARRTSPSTWPGWTPVTTTPPTTSPVARCSRSPDATAWTARPPSTCRYGATAGRYGTLGSTSRTAWWSTTMPRRTARC